MAANTGVLGELGTVVRANVTEVLERAEDPEQLVDLIFRDMAEALREAKTQVLEHHRGGGARAEAAQPSAGRFA